MKIVNEIVRESAAIASNLRTGLHPARGTAALALLLGGLIVALPGCNTTEGAGKDVQAVGRGIENAADAAKP